MPDNDLKCERCLSSMQYTTTPESCNDGEIDLDYWLCLFCGYEVITTDQIRINEARWIKLK